MRYKYIVNEYEGNAFNIEAMSYKKMLKKLDSKKSYWVTYINKKGNAQTKIIENGKERKENYTEHKRL